MQKLDSRNQELINYYLSSHTLRETSKRFGISYQRVQRILCQYQIPRHTYQLIPAKTNSNPNPNPAKEDKGEIFA